ncbi:MAG: MG2 domain-containing protein, partial [Bacteroidota bacterium]
MKTRFQLTMISLGIICAIFLFSCSRGKKPLMNVSPSFREYVTAYTSGIISTGASFRVRLADEFTDSMSINNPLEEQYFKISPSVKGKTFWSDSRTLEFQPDESLPQNKVFTIDFYLSKVSHVPDSLKTMSFQVQTMAQDIEVEVGNHKAYRNYDLSREHLNGTLVTADVAVDAEVEKTLNASQDGKSLKITWNHDAKTRSHTFQVDSVVRGKERGSVTLELDGGAIGASGTLKKSVEIPALGDFRCLEAVDMPGENQAVVIRFSDPLSKEQNLDGLIRLGRFTNPRYSIEDNELTIYLAEDEENRTDPKMKLILEPYIKNINRVALGKRIVENITVEKLSPNVRFVSDGVILPSSNGMQMPFEAVNLKAVDVRVVRIYENNILQFLQANELNGTDQLVRVGRVVLKKSIPLGGVANYGRWNRFSLDLSTLMKAEPGAIYSINLRFKRQYSTYPCSNSDSLKFTDHDMMVIRDSDEENDKNWNYYGSYGDDDFDNGGWRNYNWRDRNNPCKSSYYFNKSVSKNVFASDLGIISKAGNEGNYRVFVTDIISTNPMSGVNVEFYNYQLQSIAKCTTDDDGMATIALKKKPYLLVAKKGNQTGYLKLMEGSSLSLSMFDVSGEPVQKGVKGFIYGERGVWRPGDSLFLNFILEDKAKQLPEHHPVTFSLFNPSGQLVSRMIKTTSTDGFYPFTTLTSPDAPTGNWLAKVVVGGIEFQKILKVETVKPNRLKINIDFKTDRLIKDQLPKVMLQANWLTGVTARNLKAKVDLTLTKTVTSFKKFPDYVFQNPTAGFSPENITIFEGKLDETGKVMITPRINLTNIAPGVLKASFETTVFEEGGDFSIDRFSIPYYPFKSFAGLAVPKASVGDRVLYTDKTYEINLVNVDAEENLVPKNRLKVEVFRLEWRWWWDDSEEGSADFISTAHLRPIDSTTIQTINGRAIYDFQVGYDDWGRYLIKVTDKSSGHAAGKVVYVDWPGYFRMPGGEKQAATMLTFTADKEKYKVGDKITLNLPSSPDGRALVSLENGSRVIKSFWTPTKKGSSTITFPATEEMAPNCYASITLIQPHAQTKNDLPIRLYGVIPIFVENPETHLKPVINMKNELAPGENTSITIKELTGKPMTYTLAVVDEGLLDLTRFKTPDPWSVFYAREALGVKTWDLFDLVIGAFSGELQRILSIGGDQDGGAKKNQKANRFKPMVRCFGPFELKKGESKTTHFMMPQYIGSVRVMVVAGHEGAYGFEEKTVAVKKPL